MDRDAIQTTAPKICEKVPKTGLEYIDEAISKLSQKPFRHYESIWVWKRGTYDRQT